MRRTRTYTILRIPAPAFNAILEKIREVDKGCGMAPDHRDSYETYYTTETAEDGKGIDFQGDVVLVSEEGRSSLCDRIRVGQVRRTEERKETMSELKIDFNAFARIADEEPRERVNAATCSNCRYSFDLGDCPSEWEQESWEMPTPYLVHSCPFCEDGGMIEDYSTEGKVRLAFLRVRLRLLRLRPVRAGWDFLRERDFV